MTSRAERHDPRIVDLASAASYADVGRATIRKWILDGKLRPIQLGDGKGRIGKGRINLDDIDRLRATWPGGWR